jgi:hypothetical protein
MSKQKACNTCKHSGFDNVEFWYRACRKLRIPCPAEDFYCKYWKERK